MIILTVQNIEKAFGVNSVLSGASLALQSSRRLGLVGSNGSGKTTLLRILAGESQQDSGQITMARGLSIGYLAQQGMVTDGLTAWQELEQVFAPIFALEDKMRLLEAQMAEQHANEAAFAQLSRQYQAATDAFEEADGYAWRSAVQGVLTGLGFARAMWDQPVSVLSGGERTRLCLARLLLQKPDLLLLDEPTNHLDLAALSWLEQYLSSYSGSVIIVSHDRYFLDAVCTDIAELFLGQIEQYEGNYSRYQQLRAERMEVRLKAFEHQQKEIARQQQIIRQLRAYGRDKLIKRAQSREKLLDRMELLDKPQEEQQVRFRFHARRRTGDDVLMIEDLKKSYDGRTLFESLRLHMRAGDRIALIGPNGVGKSTLLKILMKLEQQDAGTIRYGANVDMGYYDQHQRNLAEDKTVLDSLWDEFPRMEQAELRSILGCFLFTGDDVFQPIHTLSGGERGRVALTQLMLRKDNFLLLDEPTNHLDMDSREVLEQALEDFPGTLLIVSHDRYFINRLSNRVLEMQQDGVTEYLGNYDDYVEKKRQMMSGMPNEDVPQMTKTAQDKEKKRDRQSRQAEKEKKARIATLEADIMALEETIAGLEASLATPEVYENPERARAVALKLRDEQDALAALYDAWAELS